MKQVGVVICNYNKETAVMDCIQSVLESKFQNFDLYVVDNASTDSSVESIRKKYEHQLTLLVNADNLGGSGGFNTGLRKVYEKGYPYLMCIDNDALLDENAIGSLYLFLKEHKEVGMAGSKVYHLEAPDYIQQYGQKIDFDHFATEVNDLNRYEDGSMPDFVYTDSVAACSLMVRRSLVEKIGLMPEENFLYWDDTEWCYLCHRAGFEVASVGTSQVLHAMGAKKEVTNTFPTYYAWRNWISFFCKYTPKEKWEKMAETFLSSIFQILYADLHHGTQNRTRTVMLAYDDAMHGITGKAGDDRIFPVDIDESFFQKMFRMADRFYISNEETFPVLAQRLRYLADKLGFSSIWSTVRDTNVKEICLCENIFLIEDLSLKKIYIDLDDCILATEEDALDVINYNYSKRAFIFSQKPLFFRKLKEQYQR